MKRRIVTWLLTLVLLCGILCGGVSAQTAPSLQIVQIAAQRDSVSVMFLCQDPVEGQAVTVLCQSEGGEILYVGEWDGILQGLQTRSFPVDPKRVEGKYTLTLSGTDVISPSAMEFAAGESAAKQKMAIKPGTTCGQLLEQLGVSADSASIAVGETPLALEDRIPLGAQLTLGLEGENQFHFILYVAGDADDNGTIDASDALRILQHAVQLRTLSETEQIAADVAQDGLVDALDALRILQYSVKLIAGF